MVAAKQNIVIEQGANNHFEFQLYDANGVPLTETNGYSGVANMRQTYEANTSYSFNVSFANNGILSMDMTSDYTLTIPPDRYWYDVFVTVANSTAKIVEGMAVLNPKI